MAANDRHLSELFDHFLVRGNTGPLVNYLEAESHLPGPRGNLELAAAFVRRAAGQTGAARVRAWTFCADLSRISAREAPVNHPREFLAFCGAYGLGAVGAATPALTRRALQRLRVLARDERWRVREGVAMGLQELLRHQPAPALADLDTWIAGDDWRAMRAVAAGLAEPSVLAGNDRLPRAALKLHRKILRRFSAARDRSTEAFRTLRQGLGYTISVVAAAAPAEGFRLLRDLAASRDPDVRWILRENLKKKRLARADPSQVRALARLMAAAPAGVGRVRPRGDPPFRQIVYAVVARVPRGRVVTYGQVAALAGRPRAARMVGWIAHTGAPGLPWQRVVNHAGGLAKGYTGGREGHKAALRRDGVVVRRDETVDLVRYQWRPSTASISSTRVNLTRGRPAARPRSTSISFRRRQSA